MLLTHGTESPAGFRAVIDELRKLIPTEVEVMHGAGHIPHTTHTEHWVARLVAFQQRRTVRNS